MKIRFSKTTDLDLRSFPIKTLIENFDVEVVKKGESDILLENIWRGEGYKNLKGDERIILLSVEDLYAKKELFSFIESLINKLFGKRKYAIMDRLDNVIPYLISKIKLYYIFREYLRFFEKIKSGKIKNAYAIIQNDINNKNIFIMPYFIQEYYYQMKRFLNKKIPLKKELQKKKFCAFVVSSNSSRERVKFYKMLSKYKKVDSYGKVMNNMGNIIQKKNWKSNSDLFKEYKFVICFENSFSNEYITEKLPNVMLANSIPVYRGAPNVGEYFNTKSFINYENYGSYEKMIEKIIELDKDDKKYLEFLKQPWFKENKIPDTIKNKEKVLIKFYKKILNN